MTTFTDDFARSDSSTIGNGWTEFTAGYNLVSGAAVPDSTGTCVARAPVLATGDHYAEMRVGNTYGGSFVGPMVRVPTLGTTTAGTGTAYMLFLSGSTGTAFSIRRKDNAAGTSVTLGSASTTSDVRAEGLTMRLRVYDDPDVSGRVVLEGYVNGAKLLTAYDTSGLVPATQHGVGMWGGGTGGTSLRVAQFTGADQAAPDPAGGTDTTAPPVPTGLALATPDYETIRLTWTPVTATDLAGYRVYRSTGGTVTTSDTLVASPTAANFTDTGLTGGTTYRYAVLAYDTPAGNASALSTSATATATTAPPAPPTTTGGSLARWDGTTLTPVYLGRPSWTTGGRVAASSVDVGFQGYDTTLHKPIWSDGTSWRDAAGTVV